MPTDSAADIQAKLEASRKDLLDLTFRNPLLNYRPLTARGVEVVEAQADAVYSALVGHGRKLQFAAEEPPLPVESEGSPVKVPLPPPITRRSARTFRRGCRRAVTKGCALFPGRLSAARRT